MLFTNNVFRDKKHSKIEMKKPHFFIGRFYLEATEIKVYNTIKKEKNGIFLKIYLRFVTPMKFVAEIYFAICSINKLKKKPQLCTSKFHRKPKPLLYQRKLFLFYNNTSWGVHEQI